jgi:2,3-bisphosphoglycerate-dependent phosphoglycerate mutase
MYRCLLLLVLFTSCKTTTYFIVRHAEKEAASGTMMSSDVPLSAAGKARAETLPAAIGSKADRIFSTNFLRTRSTAQPLATRTGKSIELYDPRDTSFMQRLKSLSEKNILIVGHSNTVDDLVNGLLSRKELSDLPETQYGDLFIIKKKNGTYSFSRSRFGE